MALTLVAWLAAVVLAGLTLALLLAPWWPALAEWRRPTDLAPLPMDPADGLDADFLATRFSAQLTDALRRQQRRIGRSRLASAPDARTSAGAWPLKLRERRSGLTRRVWHGNGDLQLPAGINCLAEVAAPGRIDTAAGRAYRALWSGTVLNLAANGALLRWAHARQIEVAAGCRLAGRVTAEVSITVWGRALFTRLHAPLICFAIWPDAVPPIAQPRRRPLAGDLPAPVVWDHGAGRGVCQGSLGVPEWSAWRGDLVCHGHLALGAGCIADGSLKAGGELWLGPHGRVGGSLVARGRVVLAERCHVAGSVLSDHGVVLGAGCVIGQPDRPASVCAPRIEVGAGVVVYGTLWATERGESRHDNPARVDVLPPSPVADVVVDSAGEGSSAPPSAASLSAA